METSPAGSGQVWTCCFYVKYGDGTQMNSLWGQTEAWQLYPHLWEAGRNHSHVNLETVPFDPNHLIPKLCIYLATHPRIISGRGTYTLLAYLQ